MVFNFCFIKTIVAKHSSCNNKVKIDTDKAR